MIRNVCLVLGALSHLVPALAVAEPTVVELDAVGPRWVGPQYLDNLGWHIAAPGDLNGDGLDDFAVSAPQDIGPLTFDSVLRLFYGDEAGPPTSGFADWESVAITDGKVGTDAVFQFAFIPDATGDGAMDLLVAEPNAGEAGKVLLYAGGAKSLSGLTGAADAVARWDGFIQTEFSQLAAETRPSRVAGGDFDGDGLAEIVIASEVFNALWIGHAAGGFGGQQSLADLGAPIRLCQDDLPSAHFAESIAVGDYNADGFADLAVGASGCDGGAGRVFVWYGSLTGLPDSPSTELSGGDRLGASLQTLDFNGDGTDDLAVQELLSGTESDAAAEGRGNLWVFTGGTAGLSESPTVRFLGGFSDKRFGESVAMLADVSTPADGLPELVISSPEAAYQGLGQGAVYIFDGRAEWTGDIHVSEAHYRVSGAHRDAWLGHSIATMDDFDGDGYPEILIGEPKYTEGSSENDYQRGRVYMFTALPDRDEDGDGISTLSGDCDDTNAAVTPMAWEECDDGIDNDCDHEIDEGCDGDDDDDDDVGPPFGDDDDGEGCACSSSVAAGDSEPGLLFGLVLGLFGLGLRRGRAEGLLARLRQAY
jgi:hypothetical protein